MVSLTITGVWILDLFIMCVFALYISKSLFNASFKPEFRKPPPGPKGLPLVGYLPFLGKKPHRTMYNLKKTYGDIIGFYFGSKYAVVLNEYSVAKEIFTHVNALDRAPETFSSLNVGFINANGEEWLEQRKFCSSAVRDIGLGTRMWEDLIYDEVDDFVAKLDSFKGHPTEVSDILSVSVSSSILSLLIGRNISEETDLVTRKLAVNVVDASVRYIDPTHPACLVPGLRRFLEVCKIAGYDVSASIVRKFMRFLRDEVLHHKMDYKLKNPHDFINVYLNKINELSESHKMHYFSEDMLLGNLNVLYLASADTSIASLSWFLRLMTKHQDVQNKVYAEILKVFGKKERARYAQREEVPYTMAVLMEVHRFSSIVPIPAPRACKDDIKIRNLVIPKGSRILFNLWALHNDPNYWENPTEFLPERFLTDDGTFVKNPQSYAPFSLGKRNCPGEAVAWMEFLYYSTEILRHFHVSTAPDQQPDFTEINGLVSHLEKQPLCFKRRIL